MACCVGSSYSYNYHSAKFAGLAPCEIEDKNVFDLSHEHLIDMSREFLGGGSLILSNYLAKFMVHRPCESGIITVFICHATTISNCHVTLWVGFSHPKSLPC